MNSTEAASHITIPRHKTAIRRPGLSVPVQCLLRDGILRADRTLFDYGCGRGGDLEMLAAQGIASSGWDPAYRPDAPRAPADVVNLGYVINVIEDAAERAEALRRAWELSRSVLVVSAVGPGHSEALSGAQSFADGVLTSRGTFQKSFTHEELRAYIEGIIPADAVAAAPNIYYLFRSEDARQQLLANRVRRRIAVPHKRVADMLFEQHQDVLEPFMAALTQLGRMPGPDELPGYQALVERLGSLKRAFHVVRRATGQEPWTDIAARRREDLMVYMAMARFGRRRPLSQLPLTTQRDIKAFVGTYAAATGEANRLLFSIGAPANIDAACQRAAAGRLVDNALILRRDVLDQVEPVLRVYEACARTLAGEVDGANVVKLHRFSGKVTYIVCGEPDADADPEVFLRVKVELPALSVRVFDYRDWQERPRLGVQLTAA